MGLFQHLRALRKRLSDELSVPPYVVFPDSSLQAMALRRPQDDAHFASIPGVGSRKLEAYGTAFTDAIREYCHAHSMEMDLEPLDKETRYDTNIRTNTRTNGGGTAHQITLSLHKAGKSIEEIALERNIRPSTVIGHLTDLIESGETIDITALVSPGHYDVIVAAFYRVGFTGQGQVPFLRPVKDLLGDDYSYDEIKVVRAYLRNRSAE